MFRPVKVRQYLAFMKAKGYAAETVLAGSGVTQAALLDADLLMDIDQAKAIVANMMTLTGDQGIGLDIGWQTEMMDLGIVGYAMMSAQSAREALGYWINYSNSLVGSLVKLKLEEKDPGDWALLCVESVPLGFIYNFCAEEQLAMSYRLSAILTATPSAVWQLDFSYPAPSHHALYAEYFKGPINFNAKSTRFRFCSPNLDLPLRGNDKNFNEICARQCELLARQIGAQSPLVSKIREILMRARGRIPSIEVLAAEMHMSPRTLRRHLQEEGSNYQKLVNEFRSDLAKEYLRSRSITTKEIAYLLGYNDTNAFRRAFKEWTGKTAQEYRESAKAQAH